MSQLPPEVHALERLLVRRRRLGEVLLSADVYERWGDAADTAFEQRAVEAQAEHEAVTRELEALAATTRTTNPAATHAWAEAHIEFLTAFIQTVVDDTAVFVAEQECEQWGEVAAGERFFVEENVYYIQPESALYERVFGFPLPG